MRDDDAPKANRREIIPVDIPEIGVRVYVRTMTAGERDRWEGQHDENPFRHSRSRLVAFTACDEAGELLFGPDDLTALDRLSANTLDRIFQASLRLNALTTQDVAQLRHRMGRRPLRRFLFRLAVALHVDVREIERWPSPLVSEWMAYDQLEPLPDSWWQAGTVAATMANLWSKAKMSPEDFIPRTRRARRQSTAEQLAIFRGIAAAQEAKMKRNA